MKWIGVFAFLLAISCSATVFAETAPEGPVQVTLPSPSNSTELAQLPDNAEMTETLAGFQAEDEAKQHELEAPEAVQEREESSDSYAGVGPAEAEELLTTKFSSELEALNGEPARFLSGAQLIRPLGEGGALVSDEGRTKLIEGTAPVLAPEGGGKIDLSLESSPQGYQPANPIVDLEIPTSADEGVVVGEEGLEVSQAGAEGESEGRLVEGLNVFYPKVHTDTDLLVSPTATGVELFDQLRSEESPEELRFHVQMPESAQLRSSGNAAEVVAADGSKLADVPPPTAVDAQGTTVPVQLHVEGDALVLDVKRTPGEFSYPILVDPIIENWYSASWYLGYNLQALEAGGPWHWNTSDGPSSSYVYGSTSCIFTCWGGSHRGLYMSMPSGSIPAGKWGQWSISAPNSESYLGNAWVMPYWRDDHTYCPSSTYSQPYDYVGMWNESSWNRILYNESTKNNNEGSANIESWGRAFIIGMGVSSAISPKCWRDIMAGGTEIWLEDWSRPTLTTSSSGQWMDSSPIRLNVSAYDAGLGVQKFKATATNTSGTTSEWWTTNSCTGLFEAPCPHTWNLNEASQPQLSFDPSALPEGIDKLSVIAYDAAEKPSLTTNEMTVRIDHSAPTINLSGTLTEQETLGTERPMYKVLAVALDGDPEAKPEEPSKIRSGVVSLETEIDGQLMEKQTPKCAGEPDCPAEEEAGVPASELLAGQHTFTARAKDAFGHVATKELKFTITADRTAPRVSGGPLPGAFSYAESFGSVGSGNGQFNHPADVAVDSEGNVWALDKGNNRLEEFNKTGEFVRVGGFVGKFGTLSAPAGLAIDPSGNLWVADTGNNRIAEFNKNGEFVLVFGKDVNKTKVEKAGTEAERNLCTAASGNTCQAGVAGSANGQMKAPQGIAVTSAGNLWVADTGNSRIQQFGPTGGFLNLLTGEGSTAGRMKEPSSIAIGPDGSIWVADSGSNRIEQWTSGLSLQLLIGGKGSGGGQFEGLGALDVDAQGHVWAADLASNRVEEFNEAGTFVGSFGVSGGNAGQLKLSSPSGLAVDSKGNVWVADPGNNRVQKWTRPEAPAYASSLGALGSGNGQLTRPSDVAVGSEGNVWVLDKGNNRLEEFNENGEFVKTAGSFGAGGGSFSSPAGLAIDPSGNLWVADTGNNRIAEFNKNGEFVLVFGKDVNKTKIEKAGTEAERNVCTAPSGNTCQAGVAGSANGQMKAPQGIAVTSAGNLWVADTGNSRLLKFSPSGTLLNTVSSEGTEAGKLKEPTSIAIGPDGSVWVADAGNNRIQEWNSSLAFIRQFGTEGTGNGQFKRPAAIEVDVGGNVWVGDQNNNRVEEFNDRGEFLRKLGTAGAGNGQFSFTSPIGLTVDGKGNLWIADSKNNRVQKWAQPALPVGPAAEPLTASATDNGYGATSLAVKLVNEAKQVETLASATQPCAEGGCSMKAVFEALDLSERPAGIYTLLVEATDGAGNSSRTSSRFLLSPEPPQLALSGELAEGSGEPMTAPAGNLAISASEGGSPTAGIGKLSVEVDHQRVSARTFNCAAGCQEVTSSYRFDAARDGAGRSIETAATPSGAASMSLGGISCLSANDCTAVGYYNYKYATNRTLVEHWNGSAWQVVSSPNPGSALESRLESVSCVSASSCTAVGYYQTATGFSTLTERWNGSEWSILTSPNPTGFARNYLYGVSCIGPSECWAVGKSAYTPAEEASGKAPTALLVRWNGSEWTTATASKPPAQLKAVSCSSATSCIAVSGLPDARTQRWNGTSWSSVSAVAPNGGSETALSGIACTAETNCTAVGSYSLGGHTAPLAERWNGSAWSVQQTTDPSGTIEEVTAGSLSSVSCVSAQACTAVGTRSTASESAPLIEGWDGTDWALQPAAIPSGTTAAALSGTACVGAFDCFAVGAKATTNALIEREVPGEGDKTVTVEATDRFGNTTTKSIDVDVPEEAAETPECNTKATVLPAEGSMSASKATAEFESALPTAVAPSVPTTEEISGSEVSPSYSPPRPDLEAEGSLVEGETSVSPKGGFTLKGVACIAPAETTAAATEAHVVNGDSAVFANTAPETETAIRPTAAGTTVVQTLTGENAPTSYSWHVTLNPGEKLVELPSGGVAITRPETEEAGEVVEIDEPEVAESPAVLNNAAAQIEVAEYQLLQANAETTEAVVAVIFHPWIVLRQGSIMPIKISVEPDVEIPTEYTMTYEYPPFEPNFTPKYVVTEFMGGEGDEASISIATYGHCYWPLDGHEVRSPCGHFDPWPAAQYAKEWSVPPNHDRNPHFPDYKANNCTNFVSQILGRGGMHFMLSGEAETAVESWWEVKTGLPGELAFKTSYSWRFADVLPRHLWQYGLAVIDPSNEPSGWQMGDILAYDWYYDEKGNFNHLNFVVGTEVRPSGREPLIANSSAPDEFNYSEKRYSIVREGLTREFGREWTRVPLTVMHTIANPDEPGAKVHDPANLYGPEGVFRG